MITMEEGDRDLSNFADYRRQSNIVKGYRIIFRTNNMLLGAGPVDTRKGDEVWILAGLSQPVVLRHSTAKSRAGLVREFLGTAYVHRVINGEAVNSNF